MCFKNEEVNNGVDKLANILHVVGKKLYEWLKRCFEYNSWNDEILKFVI